MTDLLFIGGAGRSGKTLLKRTLGGHPAILAPPYELKLFTDPHGLCDLLSLADRPWTPVVMHVQLRSTEDFLRSLARSHDSLLGLAQRGVRTLVDMIALAASRDGLDLRGVARRARRRRPYHKQELAKLAPGYDDHIRTLMEELAPFSFSGRWGGMQATERSEMRYAGPPDRAALIEATRRFATSLLLDMKKSSGTTIVIDDTPHSVLMFDRILTILPTAKLIHVVRDPRQVMASAVRRRWAPATFHQYAMMYDDFMSVAMMRLKSVPPGTATQLRVESLLSNPDREAERVASFIDLDIRSAVKDARLPSTLLEQGARDLSTADNPGVEDLVRRWQETLGYAVSP